MRKLLVLFSIILCYAALADFIYSALPYVVLDEDEDEDEKKDSISNQFEKLDQSEALIFAELSFGSHFSSLEVKDQKYFQELLTKTISKQKARILFLHAASAGCENVMKFMITYSVTEAFPAGVVIDADSIGKAFECAVENLHVQVIQLLATDKDMQHFLKAQHCVLGVAGMVKKLQDQSLSSSEKKRYKKLRDALAHYAQKFTDQDLQQVCARYIQDKTVRQSVSLLLSRKYHHGTCVVL